MAGSTRRAFARGSSTVLVAVVLVAFVSIGATRWAPAAHALAALPVAGPMFAKSDVCMACHNNLAAPSGEDVSIGSTWRATMMANSARDPYWQASVRREVGEHASLGRQIEDECSTCHMPMMRADAKARGGHGEVFAHLPIGESNEQASVLAADGVSCTVCHQILPEKLGTPESFNGNFTVDAPNAASSRDGRRIFGPYEIDAGRQRVMHSSSEFRPTLGAHVRSSELCATCHTLYTEARDANGVAIGRLPEQVPYLEWKRSDYARDEGGARSCQSCHMPIVAESTAVSGVLGQPRARVARHDFRGGNAFMLRMLNRYRRELGVEALPQELEAAARRTTEHSATETARVTIENARLANGRLLVDVLVRNLSGHKLPTAYPSRRVWIHVTARDAAGRALFESGALGANGAITGNDGDSDATAFEPHHREIERADEVQVYESVMGDAAGKPTTGLLSAVRYLKDNRLLPSGFRKDGAPDDVAVRGDASIDADFVGGSDRVRYSMPMPTGAAPAQVEVELLYQSIAYRWAQNLAKHPADETRRFGDYYASMASYSAVPLARAETRIR